MAAMTRAQILARMKRHEWEVPGQAAFSENCYRQGALYRR